MFEVVVDLACEQRTCPFRAVDPATGDVIVQGPLLAEAIENLPTSGPGEVRVRFTAEQWAALAGQ